MGVMKKALAGSAFFIGIVLFKDQPNPLVLPYNHQTMSPALIYKGRGTSLNNQII